MKGSIVAIGLGQLHDLVRRGVVKPAEVEAALGTEGVELAAAGRVLASSWYPVELYDRILDLMMRKAGGGRPDYLAQQGYEAAIALAAQGVYPQLERRLEGDADAQFVRLLLSLARAMYNFTTWELADFCAGEGRFEILVSDAAQYPDTLRWRNHGFLQAMTTHAIGQPTAVTSERETPDRIRFRVRWGLPARSA